MTHVLRLLQRTHLLLHESQLLQVALQESHLLLLCFAVAITNDIVILLFDIIKLNLKLNDLSESQVSEIWISDRC
jgi:hypothetical protein